MRVITARNINEAYSKGVEYLRLYGRHQASRVGDVIVSDTPVTTVYYRPKERVLLAPGRTGNPVFHAMSAIWMLAGQNDARWLDTFVHDFSSRFAEADGRLHGAYGYRWRHGFEIEAGYGDDQINTAIKLLKANPSDRQVVLQMWDPAIDLGTNYRDRPCNMSVALRINLNKLDITVFNRSNDIVWGLYGENHVQFSMLQEYLAAMIGCEVGVYYHVSNNYHIYKDIETKLPQTYPDEDMRADPYRRGEMEPMPLVSDPETFDYDCKNFIKYGLDWSYNNDFFNHVLMPMLNKDYANIEADDWRKACQRWDDNR